MKTIESLRNQTLDWNELSLEFQETVDDIWAEYGFDAACVFLLGA